MKELKPLLIALTLGTVTLTTQIAKQHLHHCPTRWYKLLRSFPYFKTKKASISRGFYCWVT